jgi:hypothetical protein
MLAAGIIPLLETFRLGLLRSEKRILCAFNFSAANPALGECRQQRELQPASPRELKSKTI